MKYQILVDSASDLTNEYIKDDKIGFKVIPLTININDKEYVDDDNLDCDRMLADMHASKKNSSACPAPESFLSEFANAEYTFVVTITSKLSGCFNSAHVAQQSYDKPENIFLIDSKAVSGTEILIVDKLVELIKSGMEFEDICKEISKYRDKKNLYFILQKCDNLINNGRMSKIAGLIASKLVIRPICIAHEGEIKMAKKIFGIKNAFAKMIQMICEKAKDFSKEVLIITHCQAEEEANQIKTDIEKQCNFKEVRVLPMRGLCSYYALEKGIIVCH